MEDTQQESFTENLNPGQDTREQATKRTRDRRHHSAGGAGWENSWARDSLGRDIVGRAGSLTQSPWRRLLLRAVLGVVVSFVARASVASVRVVCGNESWPFCNHSQISTQDRTHARNRKSKDTETPNRTLGRNIDKNSFVQPELYRPYMSLRALSPGCSTRFLQVHPRPFLQVLCAECTLHVINGFTHSAYTPTHSLLTHVTHGQTDSTSTWHVPRRAYLRVRVFNS
jgi:hypothetical protein